MIGYTKVLNLSASCLAAALLGAAAGCNGSESNPQRVIPASAIALEMPEHLGAMRRPAVEFDHDFHSDALKDEGCKACHAASPKKATVENPWPLKGLIDSEAFMNFYHRVCSDCHEKHEGKLACGECHVIRPESEPFDRRGAFDEALHDFHMEKMDAECDGCHHVYDEAAGKLVYKEGEESKCEECHKKRDQGRKPSLEKAVHLSCITCHSELEQKGAETGPVECGECHQRAEARGTN